MTLAHTLMLQTVSPLPDRVGFSAMKKLGLDTVFLKINAECIRLLRVPNATSKLDLAGRVPLLLFNS